MLDLFLSNSGGVVVKPLPLSSSSPPVCQRLWRLGDENRAPPPPEPYFLVRITRYTFRPTHPHPKLRNVVIVLLTLLRQSGTLT